MSAMTVKEAIESLQKFYSDDSQKLLIYWWDSNDMEEQLGELHVTPERAREIWEETVEEVNDTEEYALTSISESISEAMSALITQEELDHDNCMVVRKDGVDVHVPFEQLGTDKESPI